MTKQQETIWALFPELHLVNNKKLAEKACDMWIYFWENSNWANINKAPFSYEGTELTLVKHIQSTVKGSIKLADTVEEVQGIKVDRDVLIIGAILHDVSKLLEYCGYDEKGAAYKSYEGKLYQHAFLGAAKALEIGLPSEIVSIILCHTPQTNAKLQSVEGLLIKCADTASANSANKQYDV